MDLTPRVLYGDLDLTDYPYAVIFGADFGGPEVVTQVLASFLPDGEVEIAERDSNRTLTLSVLTEGTDLLELAEAEKALALEARKARNTLTIDPGDDFAPATVFETFRGQIKLNRKDVYEQNSMRVWDVTISALPYGRDADLTTVQATTSAVPPVTPTTVTIDDCSSASGWNSSVNGADLAVPSTTGTTVFRSAPSFPATYTIALIRSGLTIDLSSTRIIAVDWRSDSYSVPPTMNLFVGVTPTQAPPIASGTGAAVGYTRTWYQVPPTFPTSAGAISFAFTNVFNGQAAAIDNVARTNVAPSSGTDRQRFRSLTIGGSARTQASLAITAPAGETLGDLTILYTRTAATGLQPPLRPWRSSSDTVNSHSTGLSGSRNSLGGPMSFLIPANRFQEATHDLAAYLRATTAGTYVVYWGARLATSAGVLIPESTVVESGQLTYAFTTTWGYYDLGTVNLPTVPVAADSTHCILLTMQASSAVVEIDDGWLFDTDNGALSVIASAGLTRIEARTGSVTTPRPTYWGGTADGGDATALVRADARVFARDRHSFEPGVMDVFTANTGTTRSAASASFFRAWHTHAAA